MDFVRSPTRIALLTYLATLPLVLVIFAPGLDNYFWSEDAFWLARGSRTIESSAEALKFYGRDFNPVAAFASAVHLTTLGPGPLAGHAFDLALHLFSGALLAILFARLTGQSLIAGFIALLWALSRHTDELVFWIAARPTAIAFCLFLLAWNALELNSRAGTFAGWIFYLLAILAKEPAVILAPLFAGRGLVDGQGSARRRELHGLAIIFLGYFVFRVMAWMTASGGYLRSWTVAGSMQKGAFIILQYLEILPLPWASPLTSLVALAFLCVAWRAGGRAGKIGCLWLVLGLALFLPLPKHSPRYNIFGYPGFLLASAGLWLTLRARFGKVVVIPTVILTAALVIFQAYTVFLDELDYDMRSRYIQTLADDYARVAPNIANGPLAIISASRINFQPEINSRLRVSKLNAPVPGGLWGILPLFEVIVMKELPRGRVWIESSVPLARPTILVHSRTGFHIADTFPIDPDGAPTYGYLRELDHRRELDHPVPEGRTPGSVPTHGRSN